VTARDARIAATEEQVRARLGQRVWGVDRETLAGVIGRAAAARGWRVATAEALTGGEVARALSEDGGPWYAGGVVLPRARLPELMAAVAALDAEVLILTPHADENAAVTVRTPGREESAPLRYASPAEARRRGTLAALDLARRRI